MLLSKLQKDHVGTVRTESLHVEKEHVQKEHAETEQAPKVHNSFPLLFANLRNWIADAKPSTCAWAWLRQNQARASVRDEPTPEISFHKLEEVAILPTLEILF